MEMNDRSEYFKQYYIKNKDKKKSQMLKRYYQKIRPKHLKNRDKDEGSERLLDIIDSNNNSQEISKYMKNKLSKLSKKKDIIDKIFVLRSLGDSEIIQNKIKELEDIYYKKFKERINV